MNRGLLPADSYITINKSIISDIDLKILNMLYLPIIGSLSVMLYHTLLNDLDKEENLSDELEHAHLLSNLHISIGELLNARHNLEAIGLMKTYFKTDTVNRYIYELYSPISAHEFFSHPVLNVVLYNNVGKREYERLVSYFKMPKINKEGYEEITHTFSEVFESVPYTSSDMYNDNINFTPQDILDKDFNVDTRGYRPQEVDKFLDIIIKDYTEYNSMIKKLLKENRMLEEEISSLKHEIRKLKEANEAGEASGASRMTNLDLLKRISNLEKTVYGKNE